ncbi:hypothetical protein DQ04_07991050 [Trypanosoma grayi]|uniref:hypothetical protein n=1 Tax=Trypanosoma grayi TaxID=71804 RepID=UPI0004F41D58|nr:hypothetical protein DQ04_07991050 [Trypanosoma grayi]KEG08110.1 hypothetical protein DQ04_07991050 [Trypanosoma grayi]
MCSTAVPVNVLGCHVLDVCVFEVEGTVDLDFVVCEPAANERDRIVDYSWLRAATKPRFRSGDALAKRVRALVRWIERCYAERCTRQLPDVLRVYSKTMGFEYDAYLSTIVGSDGRRVEGVVQPSGGRVYITLAIPLLLQEDARVRRCLATTIEMYAKAVRHRIDAVPVFSRAELSLLIACAASDRDAPVEVLSERIAMHVEVADAHREALYTPFVHSCVTFRGLPQYSATLQRGASFMDYVPALERALLVSLREPLHFLEMVITMSAFFGQPLAVNIATNDLDGNGAGGGEDALVRSVAYCVVDAATQFSFAICVRYLSCRTLPSIGIIANQYMAGRSQESTLRMKLQYPEAVQRLEQNCGPDDKIDIVAFCGAVERVAFEGMSFLISTCQ